MNKNQHVKMSRTNQPKSLFTSHLYNGKDMADFCLKNLKKKMKSVTAIMVFIICFFSFNSFANVNTDLPLIYGSQLYEEPTIIEQEKDFIIDYILDEDGHLYIISIKSRNEVMTSLVKKIFGNSTSIHKHNDNGWFVITFLYNQIQ